MNTSKLIAEIMGMEYEYFDNFLGKEYLDKPQVKVYYSQEGIIDVSFTLYLLPEVKYVQGLKDTKEFENLLVDVLSKVKNTYRQLKNDERADRCNWIA